MEIANKIKSLQAKIELADTEIDKRKQRLAADQASLQKQLEMDLGKQRQSANLSNLRRSILGHEHRIAEHEALKAALVERQRRLIEESQRDQHKDEAQALLNDCDAAVGALQALIDQSARFRTALAEAERRLSAFNRTADFVDRHPGSADLQPIESLLRRQLQEQPFEQPQEPWILEQARAAALKALNRLSAVVHNKRAMPTMKIKPTSNQRQSPVPASRHVDQGPQPEIDFQIPNPVTRNVVETSRPILVTG